MATILMPNVNGLPIAEDDMHLLKLADIEELTFSKINVGEEDGSGGNCGSISPRPDLRGERLFSSGGICFYHLWE